MNRLTVLMLAALLLMGGALTASADPSVETLAAALPSAAPASPGTTFSAEAATEAYMATMSAEATARSNQYFEGGYWLTLWDLLATLALAWLLLRLRVSARMRDWAERTTRFRWLQTALYSMQYFVVSTLILLPWAAYEGYFREHQYGMSNQDLGGWLGDEAKGLLIAVVLGSALLVAVYAVIRKAPRSWWLWGAGVALFFVAVVSLISPRYLEPVFNKFYPIADTPLKAQILSLARANDIPVEQVYEFDASKQTTKMSAHVSGILGSAQISMNDNLMSRASPEEIKAVLGHEMGHYVLNHEYKGLLFAGALFLLGFAYVAWAFERIAARNAARWGLRGVTDVAGLPLLFALFSVYMFVLTPVQNTLIRTIEAEADAFGLNAARQPDGFAQAAVHLSEYRKMRPGPVEEFVFFDHPSGWNRIHRAMVWKAENLATADIQAYDAAHHPPGTAK